MTNHYPNEQDAQMNVEQRDPYLLETLIRKMDTVGNTIYCQSCKKWAHSAKGLSLCGRCKARANMGTQLTGSEYVRAREFFAEAGLSEQEIDNLLYSPDFLFGIEVSRKIFSKE